jgi:hypothetical protein
MVTAPPDLARRLPATDGDPDSPLGAPHDLRSCQLGVTAQLPLQRVHPYRLGLRLDLGDLFDLPLFQRLLQKRSRLLANPDDEPARVGDPLHSGRIDGQCETRGHR